MHSPVKICLAVLVDIALGDPLLGGNHRFIARQGDYGYGFSFPVPPFPVTTGPSGFPTISAASSLSKYLSGSSVGSISVSGVTSGPYGNSTISPSGTAYSTGSLGYPSKYPNSTSITISGRPSSSSNATTSSSVSGDPGSYGTVSATVKSTFNGTGRGYPYPTHGPYPFSTSKKSVLSSGIFATGTSSSGTGVANYTSAKPTDPSASRSYPTHGPYPRPSSRRPYSYSASSIVGVTGTAFSSSDPSSRPTISANATTIPASSGTIVTYDPSVSASFSISVNATSVKSTPGLGPSLISTSTPLANATSSIPYPTSGLSTGTGTLTGTGDPFTIAASATTVGTTSKFSYTATIKSQPSEYYYHHRRPHHSKKYNGD